MGRCLFVPLLTSLVGLTLSASAAMDAVWVFGGGSTSAQSLEVELSTAGVFSAADRLPVTVLIESDSKFENVVTSFTLSDPAGEVQMSAQQVINIAPGLTHATFVVDPALLETGSYRAECRLNYTNEAETLVAWRWLKRVSEAHFMEGLNEVQARLDGAARALDASTADYPYLRMRIQICRLQLEEARTAAAHEAWTEVDRALDYLLRTLGRVEAGMVFSSLLPELQQAVPQRDLRALEMRNDNFTVSGQPVYLVGKNASTTGSVSPDLLAELGLNLITAAISPTEAAASPETVLSPATRALLTRAAERNIAVAAQFDVTNLPQWVQTEWPAAGGKFTNAGHTAVQALIESHLSVLLPQLDAQPAVIGVSLLDRPRFQFDGAGMHRAFIDHVRVMYPDRQRLNQTWHAHLADYEDILVWGHYIDSRPSPDIPEHMYPNRRAYQYDFQTFHRGLVNGYVSSLTTSADTFAPGLPNSLTFSDDVFEAHETLHGLDREAVSSMVDFMAVAAGTDAIDPAYALNYPKRLAVYTYLLSLEPEKPLIDYACSLDLDPSLSAPDTYRYVHTAVWETFMTGVDGLAVENAEVFAHPDALEALASGALDVNRLAGIVSAFQDAPADVAVLISEASKILDGGVPHLESALFALEGSSFSGYKVGYVTEKDVQAGKVSDFRVLVIPHTPAVEETTFLKLEEYVEGGGVVARVGTPIPYEPRGNSRTNVLRNTANTVLVRGMNLPTEYLHAMDAISEKGTLTNITRAINEHGYPLEGVRTRFVEHGGDAYFYCVNLRKEPVNCFLTGGMQSGRDLIGGREVRFPRTLSPLEPMLVRLDRTVNSVDVLPVAQK